MEPAFSARYDFLAPARIVFGWGRRAEIGEWAATLGRRAFVVSGSRTLASSGVLGSILDTLREAEIDTVDVAAIAREPLVEDVDAATATIRAAGVRRGDFVLGIGGGSALDLAKAASAMATNTESDTVRDYLEGVGTGLQLANDPLAMLAVPTTAGTGTEATKNAVISGRDPAFKKSLRSDRMIPRIALVDPELTQSLPPATTAYTGMDALTQLIESFISKRARPIPQALARQGISLAAPHISTAVTRGADPVAQVARERLAHAALLSGLALANSGLGLAHGVAAALGIECDVPHGLACAVMLPAALRVNREVRAGEIAELGRVLSGNPAIDGAAAVDAALEWIDRLYEEIDIPRRLRDIGVDRSALPAIVRGSRGNSMSGNPREVSDDELRALLEAEW